MKPNQNETAFNITTLLGGAVKARLDSLFRCMELAEEAITAAKARTPEHATQLHAAFRALQPSEPILASGAEKLYPAHCHELLDRVAAGEDLRAATTAEVLGALSVASLEFPLDRPMTYLYWQLFSQLFPADAVAVGSGLEPIAADSTDRERARSFEARLRRKLAVKERSAKPPG